MTKVQVPATLTPIPTPQDSIHGPGTMKVGNCPNVSGFDLLDADFLSKHALYR
jgi:hypothetical protein